MFARTVFWAKKVHFRHSRPISVRLRCYNCRRVPVPRRHSFISICCAIVSCLVHITTSYQLFHGYSYVFRRGVRTSLIFGSLSSVSRFSCLHLDNRYSCKYLILHYTLPMSVLSHSHVGVPRTATRWQVMSLRWTLSSTEWHQIARDDTTKFILTKAQMIYVTDVKLFRFLR
jgi:hypothetical protein